MLLMLNDYACSVFVDGANRQACTYNTGSTGITVPGFVRDSHYCESRNPAVMTSIYVLYSNDSLWDGQSTSQNYITRH